MVNLLVQILEKSLVTIILVVLFVSEEMLVLKKMAVVAMMTETRHHDQTMVAMAMAMADDLL